MLCGRHRMAKLSPSKMPLPSCTRASPSIIAEWQRRLDAASRGTTVKIRGRRLEPCGCSDDTDPPRREQKGPRRGTDSVMRMPNLSFMVRVSQLRAIQTGDEEPDCR